MQYDKDILERTGIFLFENAVSSENCQKIIADFYTNEKEHFQGKLSRGVNTNVKNTTDYYLKGHQQEILTNSSLIALEKIVDVRQGLKELNLFCSGMQFQKNEKSKGYFRWHTDYNLNDLTTARILAPIFYLNDVEEGGETEFMYQKFSVKPKAGNLVIFPATWQYYHRGVVPKSNNKYIVTTFICSPRA